MSKEKRRVPKLRFPGFTEDWEQRKLGQFTARVTRKNGGQSDLPLTISAQDGLVDQRKYFNRQVASRDMSNYYLIKKGEFAYNKSYSEGYPFGAVKRLDYYDIGALSTLYILFEITDKNIISDFIVSYYMTHLWYKEISKRAAEGARNHGLLNISTEDFFDSELNIPNSMEEQVKIGNFIKAFDKFITLHQRKLDHLKLKKKALLQKLFPKNGERYPELRFPGFTDAWEQRKFGKIYERAGQKNDLTYGIDKIISVANMYFKKDVTVGSEEYLKTYNVFKLGDIAFEGHTNKEYRYGRFVENTIGDGIVSHIFDVFTPKINLDINFWKDLIKYEPIMGPILRRCTKASRMMSNLTTKEFLEEQILCPTLEEQKLIGEFIVSLDKNITLHQRKLDHLQLQKKALLQQMFV